MVLSSFRMDWHLGLLVSLLVVSAGCLTDATSTRHMNDFIKAVESIEAENPGLSMLDVVKGLRKVAGLETDLIKHYLGNLNDVNGFVTSSSVTSYIKKVINHKVSELGEEDGVVLTLDGSNVALAPMLLGLEVGLQSTNKRQIQGLYALTLTENLVASFAHHASYEHPTVSLGTKGFWDSIKSPKVYSLSGLSSLATDALIIGGIDGLILWSEVTKPNHQYVSLSHLLKSYYSQQLSSEGLDAAPRLISQKRRMNFKKVVSFPLLKSHVTQALTVHQKFNKESERERLDAIMNEGFEKLIHIYTVCPNIITRSQWGAAAYIGSPTYLSLPVPYLFIHHTYEPSRPCTTFEQCASDMRSMQKYHQQTNGWDDIGYSFVAGSDGNLYEGRGWNWVGAHTKGYNSRGYGISFIGDYTSSLPVKSAMDMVRYDFTKCAVDAGRLSSAYSLYGHRQAVSTECPGNAFYREIQNWEHYESYLP
ncbi:peptidoglycan recognition protein 6 [Myxocyprinus asiaticus]|uniref:peptidoglycan recognition protein 6 n=1 Tax=Myxocyprinus asiaticus TaxID=70543 RepID=UPI0022239897|nr:peptidoglycan recognition protein 6 [Myxocyprinus asiaticus]